MRRLGLLALLVIAAIGAGAGWLDSQISRPYRGHRPEKVFVEFRTARRAGPSPESFARTMSFATAWPSRSLASGIFARPWMPVNIISITR